MIKYTVENNLIYKPSDIKRVLLDIGDIELSSKKGRGEVKKVEYLEVASAFDIEVSSWKENEEKKSTMYCWQFGINGYVIIGRTWKQFINLINTIVKMLELNDNKRLIIYVHNLSYEYQFIKKLFKFSEVLEISERKVIKAVCKGIEFRCSYALTNKSLEKVGEDLIKYKVNKAIGNLDYKLIRNSVTPLTSKELEYCINDVKVIMSLIQEKIEFEKGIINIPLTSTGYVRKICKNNCYGKGTQRKQYHNFIKSLKINEEVYNMLKDAFSGGYVHCNPIYSGEKLENISSYDFVSSYPSIMLSQSGFPMSSPEKIENITEKEFKKLIKHKCCLFEIEFYNLKLKDGQYISPLSVSKCDGKILEEDNGRVVEAENVKTTITEQDFEIINMFYDYTSFQLGKFYTFRKGRLPYEIINTILYLYNIKTQYKDVSNKELEYMLAKNNLNSVYGMMVTDIKKQFDDLDDYNNSYSRFLYYPWGIWTTAFARKALFTGIFEAGEDFVYCDTDSIKIKNAEAHKAYIDDYNRKIVKNINDTLSYHGIDKNLANPVDKNGINRQIGIWNYEGVYEEFKALRAKAYICKKNNKYELTLSGVNKVNGLKYLMSIGNPIDNFKETMVFPVGTTGKLIHTYIDDETSGEVVDYLGNKCKYKELSSVHMEECGFDMNMENESIRFAKWLFGGEAII